MAMACTFYAIPRGVLSAGKVRFLPIVMGNTYPIISYDWDFGDGTSHGTDAMPVHTYPTVTSHTRYTVVLTVTDAASSTATLTKTDYISCDAESNVPAIPNDGTYFTFSVLISDGTSSILINRVPWYGSNYIVLSPKSIDSIDKIGTLEFQLLDCGDNDASEQALIKEGSYVIAIMGASVIFSGIIRKVEQNTQNGFTASAKVKLFDVECDSDLAKLKKEKVGASAITVGGATLIDSPGNMAKRILS